MEAAYGGSRADVRILIDRENNPDPAPLPLHDHFCCRCFCDISCEDPVCDLREGEEPFYVCRICSAPLMEPIEEEADIGY